VDAVKLVQLANDAAKNQKDKEGKKIIPSWKRKYESPEDLVDLSPIDREYSKPYYFDTFAVGTRDLNRYINDFINQYNIPFSLENYQGSLDDFKNSVNANKTAINEKIKALDSKEYKEQMVQEAFEEKERQKIEYKPLPQIISEFSRLNYLLSQKVVKENKETKVYTSCPPMDEDGLFDISEGAIKFLEAALLREPQTKDLYFNGQEYLPERNILHDKIINELFEGVKCVKNEKPIAVFTGGSPASGKSSFLNKNSDYLLSEEIFHLDADEIRAKLPEYEGWNANSTHLETQDIVNKLLSMIGSETCRYDFIYDGTMNKAKKYFELIKKVKELGYETYIIFMVVPYSKARKRALGRYHTKGRFVPMEVIDDFFTLLSNGKTKGEDALDQLKPLVDGWVVADGITGNIIDRGGNGIPSSRSRSVYGKPLLEVKETKEIPASVEVVPTKPTKEVVQNLIKALSLSVKYVSGTEKETIQKRIKALELSLKYS
jgi:predicted ABC-type ATPase